MKKVLKQWRKPLSLILALCMLLSAMAVGLTVFAADVVSNQKTSSSQKESNATVDKKTETELQTVTKWVNQYTSGTGDAKIAAEEWLWEKLIANFKKGYTSGIFKQQAGGLGDYPSKSGTSHTSSIQDDAEGTAYNTLLIYWTLQYSKMQFVGSGAWSWLDDVRSRMNELIKGKLEEPTEFDAYGMGTIVTWMSAQRIVGESNQNTNAYGVSTLAPAGKVYLTWYNSINDLPSSIPTQYGAAVAHKNYGNIFSKKWGLDNTWRYYGSNTAVTSGNINDNKYARMTLPDTTSKKALTDFANLFTSDLLNVAVVNDVSSYTMAQFASVYDTGAAVLAAIEGMDKSVAEHFFRNATDIYEEDAFTRAKSIYNFIAQAMQSAYDNFQTKMADANTTYGGEVVLTVDDINPMKDVLDSALVDYEMLKEAQKSEEVIVAAKAIYDQLLEKYAVNKEPIYKAAMTTKLSDLYEALKQTVTIDGKEYKLSDFVKADSSAVIYDNVPETGAGFIKTAADLYYLVGKIMIESYTNSPDGINGMSGLFSKITSYMKDPDNLPTFSETDWNTYGMENVLKGLGQVDSKTGFTVTSNPLLYTYNNISEIPDNVLSSKTTYTISLNENGKLKSDTQLSSKTIQLSDLKAKANFGLWVTNFDEISRTQDLTVLDSTGLKIAKEKSVAAVAALASYDDMAKQHLLGAFGYTYSQGEARVAEIKQVISNTFTAKAKAFIAEYGAVTELVDQAAYDEFFVKYDEAVALYELIDNKSVADEKLRTDIENLRRSLSDMKEYLDACKKIEAYAIQGTINIVPLTSKTIVSAKVLYNQTKEIHSKLSERSLNYTEVKEGKKLQDKFGAAIDAFLAAPAWEQTSVSYDGVENATTENLQKIIKNLDKAIGSDMIGSLLNVPEGEKTQDFLFDMITSAMFTDSLPSTIVKMFGPEVLKAAAGSESLVGLVGLYIYPNTVSGQIGDYPTVKTVLNAAGQNWDAVKWEEMTWETVDKKTGKTITIAEGGQEAFIQAIGGALKPFWKIVRALMNNEPVKAPIIGTQVLAGYAGLINVIYPFFSQMGIGVNANNPDQKWYTMYCPTYTLPSQATGVSFGNNYKTAGDMKSLGDDSYQFIGNLLTPVFDWLYRALENPVETVAKLLPTLSYMLSADMIAEGLYKITSPLGPDIVNGLTSTMDLTNINNLIKGFLPEGKLTLPNGVSLQLPDIDQGLLGGLGEQKMHPYNSPTEDLSKGYSHAYTQGGSNMKKGVALDTSNTYDQVMFYLLKYVVGMLKDNKEAIASLAGAEGSPLAKTLTTILDNDTNTILNTFIGLFLDLGDIENVDWDMSDWADTTKTDVNYGKTTNKKVKTAIAEVDMLIQKVAKEFLGMDTSTIIGDNLYTNDNLNNFVMTIFRMLGTDQLSPILSGLGIDVSLSAVSANLSAYKNVSDYLKDANSWAEVDITGLDWGLDVNSTVSMSNQFATALARVLKPFNPLLKTLIAGEDFSLLGGLLTIKGADGYSNAILPILRAIGVNAKSPEDYKAMVATEGEDAILVGIISPVLEKAEELINAPVDTLANLLPNLGYFLDNGGLTKAFNALILPITNITDQILPLVAEDGKTPTLFDFALTLLGDSIPENIAPIIEKIDFNNLDDSLLPVVQTVLSNLTIGETTLNIILPDFTWGNLAGLGERKSDNGMWQTTKSKIAGDPTTYHIEADTGASVMQVLNYVFKAVKSNQDTIVQLLSGIELGAMKETVLSLIKQILANEPENMTSAIINVLAVDSPADDEWDMKDFVFNTSEKLYANADEQRIAETIVRADLLINNVTSKFLLNGGTLKTLVNSYFSDETMKTLFSLIYTALDSETITPIFEQLAIDSSTSAVSKALAGLGNVSAAIENKGTWQEVFASEEWKTAEFGATDADSFAKALAASLAPFEGILKAILAGDDFNVLNVYKIKGANGYKNSILPILSALGVTADDGALTAKEYATSIENGDFSLYNIIKPVLNMVLRATSSPIDFFTNMLPNFAYFMDNGGLTRSIFNLFKPLTNITDQLLPLFAENGKTPTIQEFALKLLSEIAPGFALPEGLDISSIETSIIPVLNVILKTVEIDGKPLGFTIPDIDWSKLAGRGEVKTSSVTTLKEKVAGEIQSKTVVANKQDVFVAVLNYVALIPTYADNKTAITNLLGDANTGIVAEIVDNVTGKAPVDLAGVLVDLFSPTSEDLSRDWTFKSVKSLAAKYTTNLTEKDFSDGIVAMDALIPGLLASFAGGATVKSLVSNGVYTNTMVNTLAKAIFGSFATEEMSTILDYIYELGIDLSPAGVASYLVESKYKSIKTAFENAETWADVDFSKLSWGFTDGEQDGFLGSIVAMLRPVTNVLEALLTGKDFTLLDSVVIKGGEGYNNAIIPLLEALGCNNVLTQAQYKDAIAANADNVLLSIINPLFARINELLDAPIGTLTNLLPNLGYFMTNNGLGQFMDSFLLPITKVLNSVAPIYDVNLSAILEPIANIDLVETLNGVLAGVEVAGAPLGIKLPTFSWEKMAGFGKSMTFTSAQVDKAGNRVTATKIASNQPQAFVETLRYLIGIVQDPSNYATITKLVGGLDLGSLQGVVTSLLDSIATSDVDSVIEMLFASLLGIGGEIDTPIIITPNQVTTTTVTTTTQQTTVNGTTKAPTKAPVTQPEAEKSGANIPLIIGLSIAGTLALLAAGGAIIIVRKKKMGQ